MEDTTGAIAGFAAETVADATIAVDQINAAGGVNGHPLKLFVANSNPEPVAAAQSLILQDNVSMIFGISYCGEGLAIQSLASSHKIIVINTSCGVNTYQDNVTTDYTDYKYFFRLAQLNSQYAASIFDFFGNTTKPASIYFVAEDLSFTHYTFGLINQTAQQMGIKVLGATFVPLTETDFSTVEASVVSAHPSVLIDGQTGIGAATFYNQFKADPNSKGIQFLYFSDGALDDPAVQASVIKSSPGSLDGVVIQTYPGTSSVPVNNVGSALAKAYTNATKTDYYAFPSNTYTAVEIYAQAVAKAGSINPDLVIPILEKTNYQGPTGLVTFDAKHNWIFPGFWYVQIQNNTRVVIFPQQYANGHYIPSS